MSSAKGTGIRLFQNGSNMQTGRKEIISRGIITTNFGTNGEDFSLLDKTLADLSLFNGKVSEFRPMSTADRRNMFNQTMISLRNQSTNTKFKR